MNNNFNPVSPDSAADDSAEVQLRELDEYRAVLERGECVTPDVWIERRPEARPALAALRGQFCLFEAKRLQPNAFGLETPPSSPDSTLPYAETPTTHKPEIPGHEMLDECGRGGMGVVFKARHLKLDRLVPTCNRTPTSPRSATCRSSRPCCRAGRIPNRERESPSDSAIQ